MATEPLTDIRTHLQTLFDHGVLGSLSDGQLLEQPLKGKDRTGFQGRHPGRIGTSHRADRADDDGRGGFLHSLSRCVHRGLCAVGLLPFRLLRP